MGPGLEGVLPVPVHDHVLRQVFQPEPGFRIGLQSLCGIAVQQGHPLFHPAAEVPGRGSGVRIGLVGEQGRSQEDQGDGKYRHPRPKPYAQGFTHGDMALHG